MKNDIYKEQKYEKVSKVQTGQRGKMLTKTMERKYLHSE